MLTSSPTEEKDVDSNTPDSQSFASSLDPLSATSTFKDDSLPSSDSSGSKLHQMLQDSSKLSLTSPEDVSPSLEHNKDIEHTTVSNKRLVSDMDFSPRPESSTGTFLPKNTKPAPKFDVKETPKSNNANENKERSSSPMYSSPESFKANSISLLEDDEDDEDSKLKDKTSGMLKNNKKKKNINISFLFFFSTSF